MNRQEHLLTIVGEECSEVHQVCSKALRFGLEHKKPDQSHTNHIRLLQEFNDLLGAMELLFQCPIENLISRTDMEAKKERIEKFLEISKECGRLSE